MQSKRILKKHLRNQCECDIMITQSYWLCNKNETGDEINDFKQTEDWYCNG